MKVRIKFSKSGNMKFIGHLDTMRYFQKAMRRADIDIAYSTGFSPHQIMSFAAPLGVGITSEGEYLDIEVNSTDSTEKSVAALNDAMVKGFSVLDYRRLPDNAKTAMSIVTCADYTLTYREGYEIDRSLEELREAVHAFYEVPEKIGMHSLLVFPEGNFKFPSSTYNEFVSITTLKPQLSLLIPSLLVSHISNSTIFLFFW